MIEIVQIDRVKEGSILAKDIVNYLGGYDLKKRGTSLSSENINQLKAQGYRYILVSETGNAGDDYSFANQLSAYRNSLVNIFVNKFRKLVIDETRYHRLQPGDLLSPKPARSAELYFENAAKDLIPNDFIISLYKEISNLYEIIEKEDIIKVNLTENRNQKTYLFDHLVDCGIYYIATGIKLLRKRNHTNDLSKKNAILRGAVGAMIHDIGYLHKELLSVYNEMIHSQKLYDEYNKKLFKHLYVSSNLIGAMDVPYISEAKIMTREHHAYMDNSGIPKEKAPTIEASKILSVIDNYDILSNEWYCRKKYNRLSVIEFIKKNSGKLFDPEITETFLSVLHPFAIDEKIIQCNPGGDVMFYAKVTEYDPDSLLPKAAAYQNAFGNPIDPPLLIDLNAYSGGMIGELSEYQVLS